MILDRFRVTGRVAVVTGAGRGIGAATAIALAQAGADVLISARTEDQLAKVAREIEAAGRRAAVVPADLTDLDAAAGLADAAVDAFGRLDIVVNNVGGAMPRPFLATKARHLADAFAFNVGIAHSLTHAAVPHLLASPDQAGAVVNISSSAAYANRAAYGVSKLAVRGVTAQLAREFAADGIRVNAIAPGLIFTDTIRAELGRDEVTRVMGQQILPREGEERDIVDALLFLVSSAASFVTGETLRVSGGFALSV